MKKETVKKMANNIQQEKILHAPTNQNIAVSAGAGTGKSTTLRNKVIDLISRRVFKPSEFLIVTFTNEAANSLRNKIKSEVRKNKDLSDLVTEVDSMHIDTIDAFRLFIVKKYSKYLNISGDIGIIDDQILEIEQNKIVDELFYKLCESKNELLKEFTNSYIVKSFDDIKKHILKLSNYIDP
ncbi:MAG: UvrD-helicase domain-containing protein, partial [Bacillales bacterium]|nr:UvrD-helicase domain-containing protein [Bacillales bacterium]